MTWTTLDIKGAYTCSTSSLLTYLNARSLTCVISDKTEKNKKSFIKHTEHIFDFWLCTATKCKRNKKYFAVKANLVLDKPNWILCHRYITGFTNNKIILNFLVSKTIIFFHPWSRNKADQKAHIDNCRGYNKCSQVV